MSHEHDHGTGTGHDHPATFTEVIRRGFPADQLTGQQQAYRAKTKHLPQARRGAAAARAAVTTRKDQKDLSDAEKTAFKNAVQRLVTEGTYEALTRHHMDMSHMMHGSMGFVGLLRFLAWHRRYLLEFERELQRVDGALRPGAAPLGVPYWNWPDPFPAWMEDFLPATIPDSGDTPPPRQNAAPPPKASAADLGIILTGFAGQLPGEPVNDYVRFTYGLEGFGSRPDGTSLPAHNHGHGWIGGIMNNTSTSPTDPMFWLHHAEVDRLWSLWQQDHPDLVPPLAGDDRIMDPWTESYDDLVDISSLGYQYEPPAR
jgi:tyrosinase